MDSSRLKQIPINSQIIEIPSDNEEVIIFQRQKQENQINQLIEAAILTKNIDTIKDAIFQSLIIKRLNNPTKQRLKAEIKKNYIAYFKEQVGIDISKEHYRTKVEVPDESEDVDKHHIIVYGVDFFLNSQIESKFKGIYPIRVDRIDPSNASIRFEEAENVQNVLTLIKVNKTIQKNPNLQIIDEDEEKNPFRWQKLKSYELFGFPRPLFFRYASVNEKNFQKEQFNGRKLKEIKSTIQQSDFFIKCDEDKDFYDEKMMLFEQDCRNSTRRPRSRKSDRGERSRERSRDRRTERSNFEKNSDRRMNYNRRRGFDDNQDVPYQRGYQTDRNFNNKDRGSFTQRNFNDRNDRNFNNERFNNLEGYKANNDRNFNRQNRFCETQRPIQQQDISYEMISRSRGSSPRSRSGSNVSESRIIPKIPQENVSGVNTTNFAINNITTGQFNNQNTENSICIPNTSMRQQNQNNQSQSMIIPQLDMTRINKRDEDNQSEEGLQDIIKKIEEKVEKNFGKKQRKMSNSSCSREYIIPEQKSKEKKPRKNSSDRSNSSRSRSKSVRSHSNKKNLEKQDRNNFSNNQRGRGFSNDRRNNFDRRENNSRGNNFRDQNTDRKNQGRQNYGNHFDNRNNGERQNDNFDDRKNNFYDKNNFGSQRYDNNRNMNTQNDQNYRNNRNNDNGYKKSNVPPKVDTYDSDSIDY